MKRVAKAANPCNLKPEGNSGKNYTKRDSYALAFRMIGDAIRHRYPLEAITIEESVIADRLWSTLNIGVNINPKWHTPRQIGDALKAWKPRDEKEHRNWRDHAVQTASTDEYRFTCPVLRCQMT